MEKEILVFCPISKPKVEKFFVYCEALQDNSLLPIKYSPCDNSNGSDACSQCAYSVMKQLTENRDLIFDSCTNPLSV